MAETETRRAQLNGFAVAGMVLGGVIGGGVMPVVAMRIGWDIAVPALAGLILLVLLPASWLVGQSRVVSTPQGVGFTDLATALKAPGTGRILLLLLLLAGASGADATIPARLVDAGLPMERILILLGTIATLLTVPAGLLAGWCLSRWGWPRVLAALCLAKGAILIALAGLPFATGALAVADFILAGAMAVAVWQCYMAASSTTLPIIRYSLLTSLDASLRFVSAMTAGIIAEYTGYAAMFAAYALLALLAAVFVMTRLCKADRAGTQIPSLTPKHDDRS